MSKSLILSHEDISLKLDRMAWHILEDHYNEKKLVVIGLENRGLDVAQHIVKRLQKNSTLSIITAGIVVDKKKPLVTRAVLDPSIQLKDEAIILVDDVLNSGKTLAGALQEILSHNPKSIKTAVLANRDHHKYPVQANYVGVSLATTLKEHISYEVEDNLMNVYLS